MRVRARVYEYLLKLRAPSSVCGVRERGKMYIVGCHGLLKVSGTTPFVYQLLMTLLVMMLQLVLVMRPQLAMMLAATGDSCRAMGTGAGSVAGIHVVCSC